MQRRSARMVWGWAGVLLAGCGLGAGAADQTVAADSPPGPVPTAMPPAIPGPAGTPDPDALSDFRCEPDPFGEWSAVGTVTNDGALADYLVTVVLAAPGDHVAGGKRQPIPDLRSGGTYELRLHRLPVPAGEASCQVQVLRR